MTDFAIPIVWAMYPIKSPSGPRVEGVVVPPADVVRPKVRLARSAAIPGHNAAAELKPGPQIWPVDGRGGGRSETDVRVSFRRLREPVDPRSTRG